MMPVETVMEKPSFKHAWYNNQFALIPVQTIYEPFTVAALYEIVKIGEQIICSMTMLTILLCHSFTNLRMKNAQLW